MSENKENVMRELVEAAVAKYGSPLYIYSESMILSRIKEVFKVFKGLDFKPAFAMKANSNPALLKVIYSAGVGMDVITPGELRAAMLAGVPPEDVVWNGCGKTEDEMRAFLGFKIGAVNIDSIEELENWGAMLKKSDYAPEFYIRINSEVDSLSHPFISTGLKKHKFGVPVKLLEKFMETAKKARVKISGFHSHIGSQITDVMPFFDALSQICSLARKYRIKKLNIGGGWGIDYTGDSLDLSEYRKHVIPLLKDFSITCELGRFIIAESGYYVVRVHVSKYNGFKYFVITDGGMNHLIRPALYSAIHDFEIFGNVNKNFETNYNVVGPLCESGDVLYTNREGNLPMPGAVIMFKNAGAYGYSMASNYNSTQKPAEVLITKASKLKLIRKRETLDDLFSGVVL